MGTPVTNSPSTISPTVHRPGDQLIQPSDQLSRPPDDVTFYDDIEAYCGRLSYAAGDTVTLHVSSRHERFDVRIERQGFEPETVWLASDVESTFHPVPEDADANGCHWPATVSLSIPPGWQSGFYLVTTRAVGAPEGTDVAHAGFVVRATRAASYSEEQQPRPLLVLTTNTWNAYNNWGGRSLYTGGHKVSFRRPFGRGMLHRPEVDRDDRKARPTRWGEEADVDGTSFQDYRLGKGYPPAIGSSGWFTYERRFVNWAEANGYEFDFAISSDLEEFPELLNGRSLVVSVGHDEYWSAPQRQAIEDYVASGGNWATFSGNTMFWQVRLEQSTNTGPENRPGHAPDQPSSQDDPLASMVCYKYAAHTDDPVLTSDNPKLMTGMWGDPVVGRPESSILGGGSAYGLYHRFGKAVARGSGAFTVYRDDHWMFAGTGLGYGDLLGANDGAVGYETLGCRIQFDEFQLPIRAGGDGSPPDMEIVAFVPASNLMMGEYPASISALNDQGDLEFIASRIYGDLSPESRSKVRHGNAVMLACWPYGRDQGEVVTIGTTDWVFGLANDPAVGQVTKNVLNHFGAC